MKLSFVINKKADFVFDYLTDMQKFASVHPVITQIDDQGNDNYLVHETLKFGFVPFSFTYPVTIEKNQFGKIVIMRATVMKLTRIEMTFELKQEKESTVIEENLKFKSPFPVSMMEGIFRKQHSQLFRNIELTKD